MAINEPQSDCVKIWPVSENGLIEITLSSYKELYQALNTLGLNIVGVEFTTTHDEFSDLSPKEFRGYIKQPKVFCNWDAIQKWGGLSLSAFENKNGLSYDLAMKIRFQLSTLNKKLNDLFSSYQQQLKSVVLKDKFKHGQRFLNGYTDLVYQDFHSFLFDAGILRDNLCEYIYNFSTDEYYKKDGKIVTTAGGLKKAINKSDNLNALGEYLKKEMSDGGWLFELGNYRDLVMHSAPICVANHNIYAIQEYISLNNGVRIPSVRFPLPANPEKIYNERSRKEFDKFIENFKQFNRLAIKERGKYDCLEYAHKVFGLLSNLSLETAMLSPLKPMRHVFVRTEKGMIKFPKYED